MQGRKSQYLKELQKYDFKKLSKTEKDQRIRICLLAMDQVKNGKSICEVAKTFNVHFNSIRAWVKRFVQGGCGNLTRQVGQGRKRLIHRDKAFKMALDDLKKRNPDKNIRGIDILRMMEEKFNIKCCLSSVYVYLNRAKEDVNITKKNNK